MSYFILASSGVTFQIGGDKDEKPKPPEEEEPVSTRSCLEYRDKISLR